MERVPCYNEYVAGNWRKDKRLARRYFNDACYDAYNWGQDRALRGQRYRNPYPPGKRHDAFKNGYSLIVD